MKKILFILAAMAMYANALYIDAGIGVGGASTEFEYDSRTVDRSDWCKDLKDDCSEMGVDVGLRVGTNIMPNVIIAGEWLGYGHKIDEIQYNSYLIGPSVIFYPTPIVQLSASVGYSYSVISSDDSKYSYDGGSGFAFSATAAYSSQSVHGVLAGLRLFYSSNEVSSDLNQNTLGINLFVRYAFRGGL